MKKHLDHYHRIQSTRGGLVPGGPIFMGKKTNGELAENYDTVQALLLGLLRRKPSAQERAIMNAILCLNIYPDIRIWTMRCGAFCTMNKAPLSSALGSALSACNSRIYGVQPVVDTAQWLIQALETGELPQKTVQDFKARGEIIPGVGRPLFKGPDERVVKFLEILDKEQWIQGPYTQKLLELEDYLKKTKGIYLNYAGIIASVLLDPPFNMSLGDIRVIAVEMGHLPLLFAIRDIDENREDLTPLLPLKVSDIVYTGRGKR